MNMNVIAPVVAGTGFALGSAAIYKKVSGKPAGAPASIPHIITNDKLTNKAKAEVIKEQIVEGGKDLSSAVWSAVHAHHQTAGRGVSRQRIQRIFLHASGAGNGTSRAQVRNPDLEKCSLLLRDPI